MRKYLILLIALSLYGMARGQTAYSYRYWIDQDDGTAQTGTTASAACSIALDAQGFSEGLHALHLQVAADEECWSTPLTRAFMYVKPLTAPSAYYWFDSDKSNTLRLSAVGGLQEIDISQLPEGLHALHLQVADAEGKASTPSTRPFMYIKGQTMKAGLYWFDDDRSNLHRVDDLTGLQEIDLTSLPEGFHTLHCQLQYNDGLYTLPVTRTFYRKLLSADLDTLAVLSFIDGNHYRTEKIAAREGVLCWEADMSDLPVGFHRLTMRAITKNGIATENRERFFLRAAMPDELAAMKAYFSIDGSNYEPLSVGSGKGTFHFDLDLAAIAEGLHHISVVLDNNGGVGSNISSRFFIKAPLGGNGLTQYHYWLNDREDERQVVRLEQPVNPLRAVQLLTLSAQPLRSSMFHFEVTDGVPTMYAKNELHVCFYDNLAHRTDTSSVFVDYNVSAPVTDMEELLPDVRSTAVRPAENSVKWYWLTAQKGDSLCFKTDATCTLQLFSPTGEVLYAATGTGAVKWGGVRAQAAGTYYVALHDVTATGATTVSVDYKLYRLRGDVNGDGEVGIGDIVAVTNFMAGTPGDVTMTKADVNGDGDVGIGDIVAITNIMAGAE